MKHPRPIKHEERLARKHKTLIHLIVISAIAASLFTEGGKAADWLFLGLSLVCEVC